MSKRKRTKNSIVESDDEYNETEIPTDDGMDNSLNKAQNPQTQRDGSPEENLESFGLSDTDFDPTENLQINTKKKRSNHPIWAMYGILQKNGKTLEKGKDRIFCVKCFAGKKIKR